MQPGEWRSLADKTHWPGKSDSRTFKNFQYLENADGMGWTQQLVHHKGKLMMCLMRSSNNPIELLLMEANGEFRIDKGPTHYPDGTEIFAGDRRPYGWDAGGGRRPFNRLMQDERYLYFAPKAAKVDMGFMMRTPLDNPGVFERYGIPIGDDQMDTTGNFAMTYVPDWGRFYAFTPGGKLWTWAHGEPKWALIQRFPKSYRPSGYAGIVLWNPIKKELIVGGGQEFGGSPDTGQMVGRITAPMGPLELLPPMEKPDGSKFVYTAAQNKLIPNPVDGSYLHIDTEKRMYRNATIHGRYELVEGLGKAEGYPLGNWEMYAPFHVIPGTEVIAFLTHIKGLVLYRPKAVY